MTEDISSSDLLRHAQVDNSTGIQEDVPMQNSPPDRKLDLKSHRRAKAVNLRPVFVGLALRLRDDEAEYAVVVHDGMGVVETERDQRPRRPGVTDRILLRAKEYARAKGYKIEMFAISGTLDHPIGPPDRAVAGGRNSEPSLPARIWLELDAIPFVIPSRSRPHFSMEAQAVWAIEQALPSLHPVGSSIIKISANGPYREVKVNAGGMIHLYDLSQQARLTSPRLWERFTQIGALLIKKKIRISFFSATPRGGGVALMRHALIRVWRLLGLDVRWYVPEGDSIVFDITKRRFHNVLQGVAPAGVTLKDEDKTLFEQWTEYNFNAYWSEADGPLKADVVVIDDPQLAGLIPYIRKLSPRTQIIYRSHIEIRADLIDVGKLPQADVWNYLFGFIKQADLFVSHPVESFVPKSVHKNMPVVYMPPSTDPLDGLNKPMEEDTMGNYRRSFDDLAQAEYGYPVNWSRGYILQVSRFDPSKGIPDLAEGYRLFRKEWKDRGAIHEPPQLLITGHGSVDDPDASLVLRQLRDLLDTDPFRHLREDMFAIRAPPCDGLLNFVLRGADVAAQVSVREGFEIKVTEAIHKGKFVIATKTGGIPLQIREGVDGTLVPPGDPTSIARALSDFYASSSVRNTSECARNSVAEPTGGRWGDDVDGPPEELFTIGNASMWQYLFCTALGLSKEHADSTSEARPERPDGLTSNARAADLHALKGVRVWDAIFNGKK